jgi:Cu/Ag efflux pump CusA
MIRWILSSSLQFRFLVLAAAIALIVLGVTRLPTMSADVLPEFAQPYVEIQTEALGLAPTEVEALITVPIEEILNGVPWIKSMRSQSVTGLSSIIMFFEAGTNLIKARQMVQERLTQAQGMPSKKVAKSPVMLQPRSATSRVMMVGLSSSILSMIDLSVLARWNIKPRLMGIPGVANVSVWGQRERQLQVQVDPKRLQTKGVNLDQIIATTGNSLWVSPLSFLPASTPGSGGFVDTQNQRLGITHRLPIANAKDLAQVTVEGTKMALGSVATVTENHQPLIGDAVVGEQPSLMLVVEKFPSASPIMVSQKLEAALESLRPGLSGVEINTKLFQPAGFLERSIANLRGAGWLAGMLLLLMMAAFLFDWRGGLIGAVAIVLSLMAALFVLYLRGTTLNVMIAAGLMLALGTIIHDAILDVEHFNRRLRQVRQQGSDKSSLSVLLESATQTRSSALYATLIAILAVLPLYALGGFNGAFFEPLITSYVLAVLASMAVALTVTPALSLMLYRQTESGQAAPQNSSVASPLLAGLAQVIQPLIAKPAVAVLTFAVIALVGVVSLVQLRTGSLLPDFKENDLVLSWSGAPGASREAMLSSASQISRELRGVPGVLNVSAHVGRAISSDEVTGISTGKLWVTLELSANHDQTVAAVQAKLASHPEFARGVQSYLRKITDDASIGNGNAVVVRVYGQELDVLKQKAKEVERALTGIDGLSIPKIARQTEEQILEVRVKLAAAQQYGLKPGDVRRTATTLVNGIEVGSLFEAQKVFDVLVVGTPNTRSSIDNIRGILIDTPNNGRVPLSKVAELRLIPTPSVVRREGNSRWMDVEAFVQGRELSAIAKDVHERLKGIQFPLEYHPELLGEYNQAQASQGYLSGFGIAAALGVFLLLQAAFRSWRLAILTTLSLGVALLGGAIGVLLLGGVVSKLTLVGFLALLGIAARQQIALIQQYQHLEQHEGVGFGLELIKRGSGEQVISTLATTLMGFVALLPFVLPGSIAGFEVLRPMAVVMLGGLMTSSLLCLLVTPALYLWLRETPEPEFDFGFNEAWLANVRSADATD